MVILTACPRAAAPGGRAPGMQAGGATATPTIVVRPEDARCAAQADEVDDAMGRLADRYLWEEVERLVALYVAAVGGPADASACGEATEAALRAVARRWAEAGATSGGWQVYDLAQRAHRALVLHFPGSEGELHHVFGRLEWARATRVASAIGEQTLASEHYSEAHRYHTAALERGGLRPAEARVSASEQLEAMRRALDYQATAWAPPPWSCRADRDGVCAPPPVAPVPPDMSRADAQMLAALDRFLAEPAARALPEAGAVTLERAELLVRHGQLAQAEAGLREVMRAHPNYALGARAGLLLLRSLQVRWQDPEASAAARAQARAGLLATTAELRQLGALALAAPEAAQIRRELPGLRAATSWQAAVAARAAGNFAECARVLEDMATETGGEGPPEATLRFEAAVCHESAGAFAAAIAGYSGWLARFPGDRAAPDAAYRLAGIHERVQNVEDARDQYVRFLELAPQDPRASEARRRSITLALVTGTVEEAQIEALTRDRRGGDRLLAAAIRFRTEVRVNSPHARVVGYIQRFGRDGGPARLAIAHLRAAEALLRSSCQVSAVEGLCVEITREKTLGRVRARDKAMLLQARAQLQAVRSLLPVAMVGSDVLGAPLAVTLGELAAARRTLSLLEGDLGAEAALLTLPPSKYEPTRSLQWFERRLAEVDRMQAVYEGVNVGTGREVVTGLGDGESVAHDRFAVVIEARKAQVFEADIGLLEEVAAAVAARSDAGSEGASLAAKMQRLADKRRGEVFECYHRCIDLVAQWGEDPEDHAEACRAGLGRLVQRYEARLEYAPDWRGRVRG